MVSSVQTNKRMNGQTIVTDGQPEKHNAFTDSVGWQENEK